MIARPILLFSFLAFSIQTGATLWDGGKIVDGKCFVFVRSPRLTWDEAQASCANMGGALATISSLSQISTLDSVFSIGGEYYYIGLNDKATDGQFAWDETKSPATEITSDWWETAYPAYFVDYGFYDCGAVSQIGHIMNIDCFFQFPYLCIELNSLTTKCPAPTTPIATTLPTTTLPTTTLPATTLPATTLPTTTLPATTLPATTLPATTLPATTLPATTLPATTTVPARTSASTTQPTTTDSSAVTVTTNVVHLTLLISLTLWFYIMS